MADGDLAFLDGPLPPHSLLRSFRDGAPSAGPQAVDLVSLQSSLLKALSRSPDIVEQAKIILIENKDQEKGVSASDGVSKIPPQGRRQGMGRRKSRFSIKPSPSQDSANFNLKLDVENLADPEAYFSAVDKYENAAREVNKLRGQTSSNAKEKVQFPTTRERRPGLPRKRASYRHLGTINDYKDESTLLTGGKRISVSNPVNVTEDENGNSQNCHSLPGTSPGKNAISSELFSTEKEEGAVINKESRASILLDSLLSSFQRDDEDGVTLLQEKLQLKHIDMKKIRLPDSPRKLSSQEDITNTIDGVIQEADAGRAQVLPTMETSDRIPLAAISLLQNSNNKARLSQIFSSLCKSPLAAMAMLQKKACLADSPISAAYSSSSIDEEIGSGTPRGNKASIGKELSEHVSDQSRFISSQFELDDDATDELLNLQNLSSNKMNDFLHGDSIPKKPGSNSETLIQNEKDVTSSLSHPRNKNINNTPPQELCNDSEARSPLLATHHNQQLVLDGAVVDGSSDGNTVPSDNIDIMLLEGSPLGDNVEGLNSETQDENMNVPLNTPHEHANWNQPEVDRPDDHDQNDNDLPHQEIVSEACKDQPAILESTDQQTGQPGPSNQQEESEEPQDVPRVLLKRKARKPHPQRSTREVVRRKSLANAGTSWNDGVRRSTRHRIRPLEYWRGERLLFGRIHDSLATVIGVKCSSPGGDTLKVKSYVSDQYKDLLDLAALH